MCKERSKRLLQCYFVHFINHELTCVDMAPITSFFTKRKRPRSKSSDSVCVVQLDPPKKPCTESPSENATLSCNLPCCDLSSADPTHMPFDKTTTAREIQNKTRYFQQDWFNKHSWLVHCKTDNKAYCHTCRFVLSAGLKKGLDANGTNAFTTKGFTNWRTASEQFSKHAYSSFHKDSVWLLRQKQASKPIDEQLTSVADEIKEARRKCLLEQLKCLKLLARQGIPARNSNVDEGNLLQFLKQSSVDGMKKYLTEKNYLSPEINSELIKEMYRIVLLSIIKDVKRSKFFAIVVDETRDISGIEQMTVIIRWTDDDYNVYEDLVGLHQADKVDADSIVDMIKKVLMSLGLDIMEMRGQTYDGASVLQGRHKGVARQILTVNPKAHATHCLSHNLNLILQECASTNTLISGVFAVVQSISTVVRASPKRLAIFRDIQTAAAMANGTTASPKSLRPLCPTRWTCRTQSLTSVLDNYEELMETLMEIMNNGGSSEGAKAAPGLLALLEKFSTVFGLYAAQSVFAPSEEMAKKLQSTELDAGTVKLLKDSLKNYLLKLRSDEHFQVIYDKAVKKCKECDLDNPVLPRSKRVPKRLHDYFGKHGEKSTDHVWKSPEDYYRAHYFEIIDKIVAGLDDRFNQETFNFLISIEQLILDAANGQAPLHMSEELSKTLKGDVEVEQLMNELNMLNSVVKCAEPGIGRVTSLRTVIDIFSSSAHPNMKNVYRNIHTVIRLYLTVPLSNASAERSFSALRRIKTYLRNTLTQEHLNHLMMLNVHKQLTDNIDLISVAKTFVSGNERRLNFFGNS